MLSGDEGTFVNRCVAIVCCVDQQGGLDWYS